MQPFNFSIKMRFTKLFPSVRFLHRRINYGKNGTRTYSAPALEGGGAQKKGCVICCYEQNNQLELSPSAAELDQKCGGKISQQLNTYACELHLGKAFALTDILEYSAVAITSIGPKNAGYDALESLDEARENIRWGVGAGVKLLKERGCAAVEVDPCSAPDAAAEAAELAAWRFEVFKSPDNRKPLCHVSELGGAGSQLWLEGSVRGRAQNWARYLSDMPANKMTPVDLAQCALDTLCPLGVQVEANDRDWVEAQGMRAFLAVARGSCDTPMFLECRYSGAGQNSPPVLLAAKGVTFDSGGLCLKECQSMTENRGSMAGAAVVLAAFEIIARLQLPINVMGVIPICENMVSGQCMKVGDVVQALNGMSIQIENTDMEGRLMMADALVYGQSLYKPSLVIDVATFTHGVLMATGGGAFGCFSNSELAWEAARCAGVASGDRPWRFPLWYYFQKQITNDPSVDLRNQGSGHATPCLGAAFLKNFICGDWLHMDITGVGKVAHSGAPPYLDPCRMSGRPTRTLAVLLQQLAAVCTASAPDPCQPTQPPCAPVCPLDPQPYQPTQPPCAPVYPPDPQPCQPTQPPCVPVCPPDLQPCRPTPPPCTSVSPPVPPPCRPTPPPCPPVSPPYGPTPSPCPPVSPPYGPTPSPCPPVSPPYGPTPSPCPPVSPPVPPPCRPTPQPSPPVRPPVPPPCRPTPPPCAPVSPPVPPPCRPTPQPSPPVRPPVPPPCRPTPPPCPPVSPPYGPTPQPSPPVRPPVPPPCTSVSPPVPPPCRPTPPPCPPVSPPYGPTPSPCPPVSPPYGPTPSPCPPVSPPYGPTPSPCPPVSPPYGPTPSPCPPVSPPYGPTPSPCPPVSPPYGPTPSPCPPVSPPYGPTPQPSPPVRPPVPPPCTSVSPPVPPPCRPTPPPCPPVSPPYGPTPPPCPPVSPPYGPTPPPCAPVSPPVPPPCRPTPQPSPPVRPPVPPPCRPTPPPCAPVSPPVPPPCRPTPQPSPPVRPPVPPPCRQTPPPSPPVSPPVPPPCRPTPPCTPVCPTDPQPCKPTSEQGSRQPCLASPHTCAPKPQTCPPSTQTCAPNPQTCVPPMKHKCN